MSETTPYRIRDVCPACNGGRMFQSMGGTGSPCPVTICETCAGHGRLSTVMAEKLNQIHKQAGQTLVRLKQESIEPTMSADEVLKLTRGE